MKEQFLAVNEVLGTIIFAQAIFYQNFFLESSFAQRLSNRFEEYYE